MALSNPNGIFHDAGCNSTTSGISWRVDVLSGNDSVSYCHTEPLLHDDASDDDVVVLTYNSLPCVSQLTTFPSRFSPSTFLRLHSIPPAVRRASVKCGLSLSRVCRWSPSSPSCNTLLRKCTSGSDVCASTLHYAKLGDRQGLFARGDFELV